MKAIILSRDKVIEIVEDIDEWLIDRYEASLRSDQKMPLHHFILHSMWFISRNFIGKWYWRIFVRGVCAIKGCKESSCCGGDLPDDVCEWYCKRCDAEGINHVVYTRRLFYSDTPLHNFIEALQGK